MFYLMGAGIFFAYSFTVIIAYKVMRDLLNWREAAESPLPGVWPVLLLFYICLYWPFKLLYWIVEMTPRLLRRKTRSVKEVK